LETLYAECFVGLRIVKWDIISEEFFPPLQFGFPQFEHRAVLVDDRFFGDEMVSEF
jgi:hypothetical protein